MPIEFGFDLFPPLSSDAEQVQWWLFLQDVRGHYSCDYFLSELSDGGLRFETGTEPLLPGAGRHFRRFGSQLLMADAELTHEVILCVGDIAIEYFGSRIHFWRDDLMDEIYTREEVETAAAAARLPVTIGRSESAQRPVVVVAAASANISRKRPRVTQEGEAAAASSSAASAAASAADAASVAPETPSGQTEQCTCDIQMWRNQALAEKRRADELQQRLATAQQGLTRVNAQVTQFMQQLRPTP